MRRDRRTAGGIARIANERRSIAPAADNLGGYEFMRRRQHVVWKAGLQALAFRPAIVPEFIDVLLEFADRKKAAVAPKVAVDVDGVVGKNGVVGKIGRRERCNGQ